MNTVVTVRNDRDGVTNKTGGRLLVDDKLAKEKLARICEDYGWAQEGDVYSILNNFALLIRNTDLTDCQQVSLAEIPACDCYCSPHLRNCATQIGLISPAPDQGSVRNATDRPISEVSVPMSEVITTPCPHCGKRPIDAIRALPVLEDKKD